jgi:hypothetical protein
MKHTSIKRTTIFGSAALLVAAAAMTGCAGFSTSANTTATVSAPTTGSIKGLHGLVHGGQQPIGFATVQLYQAGTTGYGAGAQPLIPAGSYFAGGAKGCVSGNGQTCYTSVVTDANGNFNISSDYSCTLGTQVYLTATGGNPTPGVPNSASGLMAGLGLCDNVNSSTNVLMNEVTTVATVYALAAFMPTTGSGISPLNVGSSSSNTAGLAAAFSDINTLVSISGGSPMPSTATLTLPSATINTLANSIAGCINSGGPSTSGCTNLFNAEPNADSTTPGDVITATLNIARNPSRAVSTVINNGTGVGAPFAPTVPSANDLTLAATYSGAGISSPSGAAVDASGNVWIANSGNNSVTVVSHNLATANNYNVGSMNAPSAIAIDTNGNAWIANAGNSTLTELSSTNGTVANVTGSPFSGGGLSGPSSVAIDGLGNVWLSNATAVNGNYPISEFNSSGVAQSGSTGYIVSGVSAPVGIAINTK